MPVPSVSRGTTTILRRLGLALLLLWCAGRAAASWPPPGTDLAVCTNSADQDRVTVCPDGAGGMYVGWDDRRHPESIVFAQHVLASGVNDPAWPQDGKQIMYYGSGSWNSGYGAVPTLLADGNGGAVCVTTFWDQPNDCPRAACLACRITSSGTILNPVTIFEHGGLCYDYQDTAVACADGSGGAMIVWGYGYQPDAQLYYVHYRADGSFTSPLIVCNAPDRQYLPQIISDGSGGAIVAWYDDRAVSGGWVYGGMDIYAQHILANDTVDPSWTPNGVPINTALGQCVGPIGLASDGSHGAYLVWDDDRTTGERRGIYGQHLSSGGNAMWGLNGALIDQGGSGPVLASSGPYFAWINQLSVMAWNATTSPWFVANAWSWGLISDSQGGSYVGYINPNDGSLWVQHNLSSGVDPGWPYEGRALSTSLTVGAPAFTTGGANSVLAAWQDNRTGSWDIYAQGGTFVPPIPTSVGPVAPSTCISTAHPCVTVPVNITRTDATAMRGFSVDVQLSSNLMLCNGTSSIAEGTYLNEIGSTNYQVTNNGGGSYTVDCAILGLPCGATAPTGNLFNVNAKTAGADGTGTVTVTAVRLRDCGNAPIASEIGPLASITIDMTPPVAISNLVATQVNSGNDADGTTKITLTFTPPGDAAAVEVYRAPFGVGNGSSAYPEYDDISGASAPATPSYPPAAPWALTSVTASGATDEVTTRGFWYYTVFTKDACGNVSGVSNTTTGTLNYHLGDVTPPVGGGNNVVEGLDLSALGAHYGISLALNDPYNYLDVGPTTDNSVNARPTTDNRVNFEDLMMFAINFGQVGFTGPRPVVTAPASEILANSKANTAPRITFTFDPILHPGDPLVAHMCLVNNTGQVKGIHALISFDAATCEFLGADTGELLNGSDVFWTPLSEPRGLWIDAAKLGDGAAFSGSGELAVLRFRQRGAGSLPALAQSDLRDRDNHALGLAPAPEGAGWSPTAIGQESFGQLELEPIAHPNPFSGRTDISFRLPAAGPVDLKIYDVAGRLIRSLATGVLGAGDHTIRWDGRDDGGASIGHGIYFYELRTGGNAWRRKILFLH